MKAIAYVRFSSDNQREESIIAQLRAIKDYADKNGTLIIKEYADEAKSATTDDRPNFLQMFSDISKGLEVDYLLVHKLDRFARNRYDSAMYRRKLAQHGIKLLAVDQPLGDSPEDKLLEGLLESMNEFYSLNLAREVMKGMKENALAGKHTGGKPPLGYKVDPVTKHLLVDDHEAKAVKIIFDMYLAGKSYSSIISQLNSLGYKTKENKPFTNTSLYSILVNVKYTGTYVFNRSAPAINGKRNNHASKSDDQIIKIPDAIPSIISKDDFNKVAEMMSKRKITKSANKATEIYLLTGLIKCGQCNGAMVGERRKAGRNKEIYSSYVCNNRKRLKNCKAKYISKNFVEQTVIELLDKRMFSPEGIKRLAKYLNELQEEKARNNFREFERLKKEIAELETEIGNAVKLIMKGFASEALQTELTEAEKRKTILTKTLSGIVKTEIKPITTEFIEERIRVDKFNLRSEDKFKVKGVIQSYITAVIVFPDKIDVTMIADFIGGGGGS